MNSNNSNSPMTYLKEEAPFIAILLSFLAFQFGMDSVLAKAVKVGSSDPLMCLLLGAWLLGVTLWAAFGVVRHAEALAFRLGEPLGTIILTLSVVGIEVALISAVMLTGEAAPTMARDTMMALLMIVLAGLTGASILLVGLAHGEQEYSCCWANSELGIVITERSKVLTLVDLKPIRSNVPIWSPN